MECARVWRGDGALHADLDGLEWAERNIGKELSGSRGGEVQCCLVLGCCLWAREIRIGLLEILIPAILERALGRVAKESRAPAGEDAAYTVGAVNLAPSLRVTLV